jgi:L-alanine-DL-glutamate epimerase-like enolase superfamily enzyme
MLRIEDCDSFRIDLKTRMPFRYGIATVHGLPHCFVRVRLEIDGISYTGVAADHLAPKWFTKNPATSPEEDIAEMRRVILQAMETARGLAAETPWALWRDLYDQQAAWGKAEGLAPLLTNFGVTLVERAMLDAFCRAKGKPFQKLLWTDALGIRLSEVHPELTGLSLAELLPETPLGTVRVRHTVGLSDPLTEEEIADADRLNDGLPQSLAACVRDYGLRHFKLKVGGDASIDVERLAAIVATIAANAGDDWAFSIDGNESYRTLDAFREFWEAARAHPTLGAYRTGGNRLLFIEQPLHRDIALSDEAGLAFAAWNATERPAVIIDESDAELSSLPRALSLGYAGTSHKNCKGVFKGVANACLLAYRRAQKPDVPALLSGEDLSNVGPVALNQDLAVQAALGIGSVERNGQHYFRGLSAFPEDIQAACLSSHPDLYRLTEGTKGHYPTLAIENGSVCLDTVNSAPFGVGFPFDPSRFARL